jgi:hypothetical protein
MQPNQLKAVIFKHLQWDPGKAYTRDTTCQAIWQEIKVNPHAPMGGHSLYILAST